MLLKGKVVIALASANEVRKGTFVESFDSGREISLQFSEPWRNIVGLVWYLNCSQNTQEGRHHERATRPYR
jgi:hypothetical protein